MDGLHYQRGFVMTYEKMDKKQRRAFREYFKGNVTSEYVMEYLNLDEAEFSEMKEAVLRYDSEKFATMIA